MRDSGLRVLLYHIDRCDLGALLHSDNPDKRLFWEGNRQQIFRLSALLSGCT